MRLIKPGAEIGMDSEIGLLRSQEKGSLLSLTRNLYQNRRGSHEEMGKREGEVLERNDGFVDISLLLL